jgi:ACT domain-containing protein
VTDLSLSAPRGTGDISSARLRLAARPGHMEDALAVVREIAAEKGLNVVEPLTEGSS